MTLLNLLQTLPQPYEVLHEQALVFGAGPLQGLADARAQRPNAQHQAAPVALTDGRWMLCADLLTEISPGGLYADGFQLLDPALFAEVDVMPMADAVALLPVSELLEGERVRSRNPDGTFMADDPTTPDVDEAWVTAT